MRNDERGVAPRGFMIKGASFIDHRSAFRVPRFLVAGPCLLNRGTREARSSSNHAEAKDSPWGRGARGGERENRQGAYNTVKHACVAARIGDDAKRGAANMSILTSRATKSAPILAATPCGLARVLAHGFVASPLLSRSKRRALLRALSQNRASASRVSLCYRL